MPLPKKQITISRLTARERVYNVLRGWIVDGTLRPGEKLSDSEIAGFFDVSRTPVREALQMLSVANLVEIIPGRESRVTQIDPEETRQAYDALAVLHCAALERAAPRLTPEHLASLRDANAAFRAAAVRGDAPAMHACDMRFHSLFFALSGNKYLGASAETLEAQVLRVENLHFRYFLEHVDSAGEHQRIIEALERGDIADASAWMGKNWRHFAEDLDGLDLTGAPEAEKQR